MRFAHKLVLAAMAAVAAMAFAASSASAFEVTRESNNTHCSPVTFVNHGNGNGGCLLRATGNAIELGAPDGTMIVCNNTFEGRVGETGEGFLYTASLTNCNIPTVPCVEQAPETGIFDNWRIEAATGATETGPWTPNETNLEAHFCVVINGVTTVTCHLNVNITDPLNNHRYVFNTGGGHRLCEAGGFSVSGSWTQIIDAQHPAIEIKD